VYAILNNLFASAQVHEPNLGVYTSKCRTVFLQT
jgi:hypothetical protein